jgi:hypothetical protein
MKCKLGRNQPCPCGSQKKYKKCCIGTFPKFLEEYYGLLHKQGCIKDKLMMWARNYYDNDELDVLAHEFAQQDFDEMVSTDEGPVFFFDWLFTEARDKATNRRVLDIIIDEYAHHFDDDELLILNEWHNNTQYGLYQVQKINKETCSFTVRELLSQKEFEITDVKGSQHAVKGDITLGRAQQIFSKYYFTGALQRVSSFTLEDFKGFIEQQFGKAKTENPDLPYEAFMNTMGATLFQYTPPAPEFRAPGGEEITVCEATYAVDDETIEKILIWGEESDDLFVTSVECDDNDVVTEADIAIKAKDEEYKEGIRGIAVFNDFIDSQGNKTRTSGSIHIKNNELTLFSVTASVFDTYKQKVEEEFSDDLTLKKEERKSPKDVIGEKDVEEKEEEPDEELSALGREIMMQYYRDWCDQKIPLLDNKTPREAITTEEGKRRVHELLLSMENEERHKERNGGEYLPVAETVRDELGFYEE